jgi:hypothetical protein
VSQLEVYVGAASVEGVRAVIYAVSKAAPAGTTVIMAPILADAALAAAAVFISAYIIGELAAALQKAGLVKVRPTFQLDIAPVFKLIIHRLSKIC